MCVENMNQQTLGIVKSDIFILSNQKNRQIDHDKLKQFTINEHK